MTESHPSPLGTIERRALIGILALVTTAELLIVASLNWLQMLEPVRFGLAVLVLVAVPLLLLSGIVRGTVTPLALLPAIPAVGVYSYTGLVLPWSQISYQLAHGALKMVLSIPAVGNQLTVLLFGDLTITQETLQIMAAIHYAVLCLGILAGVYFLKPVRGQGRVPA